MEVKCQHAPVLVNEVIECLQLEPGDIVVDGTLGLGGHAGAILERIGINGRLIGFDCDSHHLRIVRERLAKYKENTEFVHENFVHLKSELLSRNYVHVDAILLDLGIASSHVDIPQRGFSFQNEGPLDMRLDERIEITARDIVNEYSAEELADIFRKYGEERYAYKIAGAIVEARERATIDKTTQLAEIILGVVHRKERIHPATRVFQALRIEVNNELGVLEEGLKQAVDLLGLGGRLAVISYHSLEDRIVKHFFKEQVKECICPREVLRCECDKKVSIKIVNKKPIVPTEEEIGRNHRSRSAKLRVIEKISWS